jgi:hypothetical protein
LTRKREVCPKNAKEPKRERRENPNEEIENNLYKL